jgi:hypothetical protein
LGRWSRASVEQSEEPDTAGLQDEDLARTLDGSSSTLAVSPRRVARHVIPTSSSFFERGYIERGYRGLAERTSPQ